MKTNTRIDLRLSNEFYGFIIGEAVNIDFGSLEILGYDATTQRSFRPSGSL